MRKLTILAKALESSILRKSGNGERFSATTGWGGIRIDEYKPFTLQAILIVQLHSFQVDHAFGIHEDTELVMLDYSIAIFFGCERQVVR